MTGRLAFLILVVLPSAAISDQAIAAKPSSVAAFQRWAEVASKATSREAQIARFDYNMFHPETPEIWEGVVRWDRSDCGCLKLSRYAKSDDALAAKKLEEQQQFLWSPQFVVESYLREGENRVLVWRRAELIEKYERLTSPNRPRGFWSLIESFADFNGIFASPRNLVPLLFDFEPKSLDERFDLSPKQGSEDFWTLVPVAGSHDEQSMSCVRVLFDDETGWPRAVEMWHPHQSWVVTVLSAKQ